MTDLSLLISWLYCKKTAAGQASLPYFEPVKATARGCPAAKHRPLLVAGRCGDLFLYFVDCVLGAGIPDAGLSRAGSRFDLLNRTDLHHAGLRLLQHHLFVYGANLGSLFERLAAAHLVFFGRGHRNIVLLGTNARCVLSIDDQRMLIIHEIDRPAFRVDLVLPMR